MAHPLDDAPAAAMVRSVEVTAEGLGEDGPAWNRSFASIAASFPTLRREILGPVLHLPRHPLR